MLASCCLCQQLASSWPARLAPKQKQPKPKGKDKAKAQAEAPASEEPPAKQAKGTWEVGRQMVKCSVAVQVSDRRRSSAAIHLRNVRSSHRHVEKAGAGILTFGPDQMGLHRDRWRGCRAAEAVAQWAGERCCTRYWSRRVMRKLLAEG